MTLCRLFAVALLLLLAEHGHTRAQAAGNGTTAPLKIGCFNIQVFGVSKMSKPAIADVLADIATLYDLLIIQEIRDVTGTAITKLLEQVNAKQAARDQHALVLSPRCVCLEDETRGTPGPGDPDLCPRGWPNLVCRLGPERGRS